MKWITSESGERQYNSVSPIYENSRIAQSVWDAIGAEMDQYIAKSNELMFQIKPETATYLLYLWEQRYGLTAASDDTEERRRAVIARRSFRKPMSPSRLMKYLSSITGRSVRIDEFVAPYTFGVYFTNELGGDNAIDYSTIYRIVQKLKQAHMAFEFGFADIGGVQIGIRTDYCLFPYPLCGTIPQPSTVGAQSLPDVSIAGELLPLAYGQNMTSDAALSGTYPQPNIVGQQTAPSAAVAVQGEAYRVEYAPCGTTLCGQ